MSTVRCINKQYFQNILFFFSIGPDLGGYKIFHGDNPGFQAYIEPEPSVIEWLTDQVPTWLDVRHYLLALIPFSQYTIIPVFTKFLFLIYNMHSFMAP